MGQSIKFDFLNEKNEKLAGRLELPDGAPQNLALFAHCFTCSKNILATSRIAKSLTENGIGVLRFDFTGLGNSEGDFANTNFSSNISDLMCAARALEEKYAAPTMLIGHSLGGAAVLKTATLLPAIKAVVTIGAPSDVSHVAHNFALSLDEISQKGEAKVDLAGRKFTIKKQFLDDISQQEILDGIARFGKALLILHAPLDETVSVDHAAKIFQAAKHPKSFISLDSADHLLSNPADAEYVAGIISSWSLRYLQTTDPNRPSLAENEVLVKNRLGAKFTQDVWTKYHHLIADEPRSLKGADLGLNPYQLLLASLGACTSMTIKMYAERKKISLEEVEVILKHSKAHVEDCLTCDEGPKRLDVIEKEIKLTGDFNEQEEKRLHEIASLCPVNKTLSSEIKIVQREKID